MKENTFLVVIALPHKFVIEAIICKGKNLWDKVSTMYPNFISAEYSFYRHCDNSFPRGKLYPKGYGKQ